MSPDFETPIFYFKPYPGSEIVTEAVQRGLRLPDTLEEWSEFDLSRARLAMVVNGAMTFGGGVPRVSADRFEWNVSVKSVDDVNSTT